MGDSNRLTKADVHRIMDERQIIEIEFIARSLAYVMPAFFEEGAAPTAVRTAIARLEQTFPATSVRGTGEPAIHRRDPFTLFVAEFVAGLRGIQPPSASELADRFRPGG